MPATYDVIVLGAGAAGLMCAAAAGRRGRRVLVLEGANKPGKKILMSGGGRCNFTNLGCTPGHFQSANPHFVKSALSRYSPYDFLALVEQHDIPWVEKAAGQLFCERSSKDILGMLLAECESSAVDIRLDAGVAMPQQHEHAWRVRFAQGEARAASVVVATGGLSIPKMGASGFGYDIAEAFGLALQPRRAALVPFTFTGAFHAMAQRLAGVSVAAVAACGGRAFSDDLLFTHRGLSGPAALQVSSFWEPGDELAIRLLPGSRVEDLLLAARDAQPRASIRTVMARWLPRALVTELESMWWADHRQRPIGEVGNAALAALARRLEDWRIRPAATEGYRTAEVTAGGVDTGAVSSSTFECRDVPGLYFIGEVLDVTGELGGFNFQWAWASGQAAGRVV